MTASGTLDNGMKFEWQLQVINQGGSVAFRPVAHARLDFKDCDSLTLLVAAGTDYAFESGRNYRGEDPHARLTSQLGAAAKLGFDRLKAAHIEDYQSLFNRVSVDFGTSSADSTRAADRPAQAARRSRRWIPDSRSCFSNTGAT